MTFNLKTAIGSIAPVLASMLGGPLAGTAVTALEGAFGLAPGAGADAVTQVVQAGLTPEAIAAVRAADQAHAEKLKQLDVDVLKLNADHDAALETIAAGDRDSARKREVAVRGWTVPALAWLIVSSSLGLVAATVTGNITKDPALAGQVGIVTGYLLNESKQIITYYFGSSASSQAKDAVIADAMKQGS